MEFLSSFTKSAGSQSTDETKKTTGEEGSTTELFASAKVLADAAQSQFNKDGTSTKVDNKKVAEAAADVLDATQKYGKLDETQGIGQYVAKAETYLHQYGSTNPDAAAPAAEKPPVAAETEEATPPVPEETKAPAPADKVETEKAPATEGEEEGKKGEGYGQYVKMAEGFLSKQSGDGEPEKEGGSDYLKMAGDFLGKK